MKKICLEWKTIMNRINWIVFFVVLLMIFSQDVTGRRGRGRGRSKSRVKILPCIN